MKTSLNNLRERIQEAARSDERFSKPPEGAASGGPCGCWVDDVVADDAAPNGGLFAIISAADGKCYEVAVTFADGKAALGEATEVVRQTSYQPVASEESQAAAREEELPLEASGAIAAPDSAAAEFMYMPAGSHLLSLTRAGKHLDIAVEVTAAAAGALQKQLDAVNARSAHKAFLDFDHDKKEASFWPKKFLWRDSPEPGVYVQGEWSAAGRQAVEGKSYRAFSPTFHTDAEIKAKKIPGGGMEWTIAADARGSEENPAQIICEKNAGLCFGGLVNNPAFEAIRPLTAKNNGGRAQAHLPAASAAGAGTGAIKTSPQTKTGATAPHKTVMKKDTLLDPAELQARQEQLENRIKELEASNDNNAAIQLIEAKGELKQLALEKELAAARSEKAKLEERETKRVEAEADAAIEAMKSNGQIPMLDKEMAASYRAKFVADPSLIPLVVNSKATRQPALEGGRRTPNTAPVIAYGDVKEGAVRILKAVGEFCAQQMKIKGLDASCCEKRGMAAREIAMIYRTEIRAKHCDGEGMPMINPDFLLAPIDAAADTDTLGTLAGTLVTQRFLDIFMYKLPLISGGRILTDFSDQPSELNQTVATRKVVVPAIVSFDPTLDTDGYPKGWAPANAPQTTDVTISMDELVGVPIQFDLAALSSTQRDLFNEQSRAAAYAVALYFMKKIYGVCTAANFAAYAAVTAADANGIIKVPVAYATYAVGLVDFARSKVADIGAAFDANEVPDEDRSILLNSGYYAKGTTDPSIVTFFAGQQAPGIITEGKLPNLNGFGIIKAPNFPGSNNRVGMALQRNGLLAKSRLPANLNQINMGAGNGTVTQIVHPETGLSMMVVLWTDHKRGYSAWLPCAILGAAKGDTRGGLVITSQ